MNATSRDPANLDARIARLERQSRRLGGLVGLLFLLTLVLLVWRLLPGPRTVEAEAFVVKDRAGRKRAEMSTANDGTATIRVNNSGGRARALLQMRPDGSTRFLVNDERGEHRLDLGVAVGGTPYVNLTGGDGRSRVSAAVDRANAGGLSVMDAGRATTWSAGVRP